MRTTKNNIFIGLGMFALAFGCKSPTTETTTEGTAVETSTRTFPEIQQQVVQNRAIEAVIWGMPAVNLDLMYQAMLRETKARENQMLYWSRLLDWKNQTLTPNTDVIYFTPYFNTKEVGPIVLEIPPADDGAIVGTIMDAWQMPLEDIGMAGVDRFRILDTDPAFESNFFEALKVSALGGTPVQNKLIKGLDKAPYPLAVIKA